MLHVHASDRLGPLAGELASVLAVPLRDPMRADWVGVPSVGMRRWLQLELAKHLGASPGSSDGITANIAFPFPGALRAAVLDRDGETDPWRVERLVWSILEVADRFDDHAAVRALNDRSQGRSRLGTCRRLADLFDRYHVHRPDMIRSWASGAFVDGVGNPLAEHHRWQPRVWKMVRDLIGEPSPPERLPVLLDAVRSGSLQLDLPDRLSLFGLAVLPGGGGFVELANAVSVNRDVHLFLVTPSLRLLTEPSEIVAHPLNRSWGRLHRETGALVAGAGWVPETTSTIDAPEETLLTRLQQDIRLDRAPDATLVPAGDDHSVEIHACHGQSRQVEVLRDVLLHLLADEKLQLREEEILVVCPALERFASTIDATFGVSADRQVARVDASRRPPSLRYRIADRSIVSTNPVLAAASALLDLVVSRFDGPSVLDFAALEPVRRRYRFSDDDLAAMTGWVEEANVRWGLDADHREKLGFAAGIVANSWEAAIDRLLLGVAVDDDDLTLTVGDRAPIGVEGDAAALAGRFADLVCNLSALAGASRTPRPVAEWSRLLLDAADAFFAAGRYTDWQIAPLRKAFADPVEESTRGDEPCDVLLDIADVRRLFRDRLGASPGRPDFFAGGITVTSMTPMRWVPHRVVCLLGVDQSAFGSRAPSGDDLIAAEPFVGDGDARAEARQSVLEAVLSATERLVLIRDGHDVRTNQNVPRSVVVQELHDVLAGTVHPDQRTTFEEGLERAHPRQSFDESNFEEDGPWSFDPVALDGARGRRDRIYDLTPFLTKPLPATPHNVIQLADLHAFLKNPVKHFAQQQLELRLPTDRDALSAMLPTDLGGLDGWRAGNRLLHARLADATDEQWTEIERQIATAPPGEMGEVMLAAIADEVDAILEMAETRGVDFDRDDLHPIQIEMPGGPTIVGSVRCRLAPPTPGPARVEFTSAKSAHRLEAWLDLMVLVLQDPETNWRSVGVNRNKRKPTVIDLVARPGMDEGPSARRAAALKALNVVVDCYERGQREPIPLFAILGELLYKGTAKADKWQGFMPFGADTNDAATKLIFGDLEYEDVVEMPPVDGDPDGEGGRAQRFASYLWGAVAESSCGTDDLAEAVTE